MSPLVTDFHGNLSAHRADHSEQNDTNMSKIETAVPNRDVMNRKFVPAIRTASAASVRTASAFVVRYSVHICTALQSQSFTP